MPATLLDSQFATLEEPPTQSSSTCATPIPEKIAQIRAALAPAINKDAA